jgi:hypothetical protein
MGTASKFRSNIFGKMNDTGMLKGSGYNSLKNVLPLSAQKMSYNTNESKKYKIEFSLKWLGVSMNRRCLLI